MKRLFSLVAFTILTATTIRAQYLDPYLTDETRPNGINWLPSPPALTDQSFVYDFYYYQWGRSMRDGGIGAQALSDESAELSDVFSEAFGIQLNAEHTPEIFKLAERAVRDAHLANKTVKDYYQRLRPFAQFKEASLKPETDEEEASTFSFPSGHSTRGWMFAYALTSVAPDHAEALLLRAHQYAINRVICGHHWKTDIDASVLLAAGIYAAIVGNDEFQQQLAKAREEYQRLTGTTEISQARTVDISTARDKTYTLQGIQASEGSGGIIIQHGKKIAAP